MLHSALLHGFIAGLLTFLLVRRFTSWSGAVVAGAVFSGSGWFLAHHDLIQYIQSATWIPLLLLGTDRALRRPGLFAWILMSLGVAFSFFGGMPQVTILGMLAAGLWTVATVSARRGGLASIRAIGSALIGILLGLLLSAPQLLLVTKAMDICRKNGLNKIRLQTKN
jgi:hypothetical protein